jgi:predicted  nucleic acid-binding Zn ribbon protein
MEGIAERAVYQRLSKSTSDLSKVGQEICTAFENITGKPFYYYLFRYYSSHKPVCPVCSEFWRLDENNELFIDYQCHKCRLVADLVKSK